MSNQRLKDQKYMRIALALAKKGSGKVSPNPCVGALVVQGDKIVGRGYHKEYGGPHAEVLALKKAGNKAQGATLYITLEPCSTHGKTPPCTDALIKSRIKRLVVATNDPNPSHNARALRMLQKKGIKVATGIEEQQAKDLIQYFSHWIQNKLPYVIVKEAMSLDGKIATRTGHSQWISGPKARNWVHHLRSQVDGVLIGKKTLLADNPRLTSRIKSSNGSQPIRIVIASDGKIPSSLNVFSKHLPGKTWLVVSKNCSKQVQATWKKRGIDLVQVKNQGKGISVSHLLHELGKRGISSLLVEGGGETVYRFFQAKSVDKLFLFVAPKIVGGRNAITAVEGDGVPKLTQAFTAKNWSWKRVGDDLLFEADFK